MNKSIWKVVEDELPPIGIEVIGFRREWIHPDYNIEGTRICFWDGLQQKPTWHSAKWNNNQDCYDTDEDGLFSEPTLWIYRPTPPKAPSTNTYWTND